MTAHWLALPLSARGLLRELEAIVDDDGVFETAFLDGADARAIGDELARLLCAFSSERPRVRRDVAVLLERGFLVVEGARIRLVELDIEPAPASETVLAVRSSLSQRGSAKRMQLLRARRKAAAAAQASLSHVTLGDATGDVTSDASSDASSDAGDASRSLSFKINKIDSTEERARERHRDAASDVTPSPRMLSRDTPFDERARAIAEKVGVRNAGVVWLGFVAHFAGKRLEREWEDLWQTWVAREKTWERDRPSVAKQHVDLDAPWMRTALGESS